MAAAVSPSFNGLSSPNTPKQKRGSWFSRTPHRKSPPVDEDIPVLKLAFFSGKTIISFGKVKVNRSKSCKLRLVNPADLDVQLVVERFPSQKGFTISEDRWVLESQEEQIVSIRWSPTEAGNVRELVTFKFDNAHRLQVIMVGTSVASPVKKTKKRSKWNVKKSVISELRSTKLKKQCKQLLKDGKKHRSPNVSRFDEENIHPNEAAITNEKTSPLGMLITPMPTTPSSIRRSRTFEKLPNPSFLNASIDSQSDFRLPLNNSALNISISPNRSDINPMLPSQPLVAEEDSRLTFCIGQNASSVAPPVEPLSDLCNLISYQGDVDHSLAYSDIHGTSLNTSILVSEAELLANHTADILGSFLIESPTQPSRRKCSSTPLTDAKKGFLHAMQCEEDSKAEIPRKELFKEPQMLPMKRKPKSTTVNAPLDTETTNKPARKNSVSSGASSANSRKNHTGAIPKKKFSATATKPSTIRVTQSTDAKTTNSFDSKRLVNRITKSDVPRRGVITTGKPKTESFAMPPRITKRLSSVSGTITHPSGEHIPLSTSILEPNEEKRKPENLTRKLVSAPIVPLQPLGESQMLSSSVAMEPDDQSLISDACTVLDQSRRLLSVSAMITEPSGESKLMSQSMDQGPCVKNLSPISAFLPEPLPLTCPLTTESEQVVSTSINSLSKSAFITGPFDESISRMTAEPRRLLSGTITKPSGETRLLSTSITETPKESTTVTLDTRHLSSASATITKPCGESKVLSTTITKEPQEVISRSGQATKQLFLTPREPCNETQTHFPGPPVIVETENRSRRLIQAQIVTTEPCGKLTLTPRKSSTRSSAENNVPSVDLRRLSSASATITKPCGEFRIVSKTESQKAANGQSFTNENLQHVEENDESMLTPMGDLDYSQINNTIDSCLDTYSRTSQKRTTQGKQQEPKRARVESYRDKLNDKKCSKPPTAGKKRLGSTSSVKGLAMSKLSLQKSRSKSISSRPMMYASQNMYYDEKWMKKQELGFTRWLNFILTPDELDCPKDPSCKMNRVDAGKILCMDTKDITLAPTKEELSLKSYTATRRLNRLRRSACMLFESESIVRVVHKIEEEIESLRLLVRADKHINKDYGVRQQLLNMILCYNPLWLRIGLETIYGVVLNLKSNTDVHGLSTFIVTRLLNNPMIASDYSHPTVPNLFKDGYEEALAKFTLKKFLLLVLFLDRAKLTKLIDHDPCLFCKDAEFKSSRNLLLIFSRDFLSGEGDVTRHLGYLGYTITATQTSLDEFDYAVSNIAVDLRCGIRLTRIMGLLTHNWKLLSQLRTPAISRLQKIHNVGVCLKAMKEVGIDIESGGLSSKDIIDGHREKTLELLWRLVFHFQISINLNENQIQEEVTFLKKNLRTRRQLQLLLLNETHVVSDEKRLSEPGLYYKSHKLSLLLEWSKAVCAYYNLKVENFTVSFSDGRVLCCLVHHYHPSLLPWNGIRHDTTQSQFQIEETESDGEEFRNSTWCDTFSPTTGKPTQLDELLTNEKHNFKMVYDAVGHLGGVPVMIKSSEMSHTIPNEKVVITFLSYLCNRLLDLCQEGRAARVIQSVWREYKLRKTVKEQKLKIAAAIIIQRHFRDYCQRKREAELHCVAIRVQSIWRGNLARKKVKEIRKQQLMIKQEQAAVIIQSFVRRFLAQRLRSRVMSAVVRIQSTLRGHIVREHIQKLREAVKRVESVYFAKKVGKTVRQEFLRMRFAAITLQSSYRAVKARKLVRELKAAVKIQSAYRCYVARKSYKTLKKAVIIVQSNMKMSILRRKYKKILKSTLVIQARYRAWSVAKQQQHEYKKMKMACITIQSVFRGHQARLLSRQHRAARLIQCVFRMHRLSRKYQKMRSSAIVLQAAFKSHLSHKKFQTLKKSAIKIQQKWKATLLARRQKKSYLKLKGTVILAQSLYRARLARIYVQRIQAAVKIQSAYRGYVAFKNYKDFRKAVITIQSNIKMSIQRRKYKQILKSTKIIQEHYRAHSRRIEAMKKYQEIKTSCVTIQTYCRRYQARKTYRELRRVTIQMQALIRRKQAMKKYKKTKQAALVVQRRFRANLLCQQEQKCFHVVKTSCITIQSYYRGFKARQLARQHRSATIIKSFIKMCLIRKEFLKIKCATIKIQANIKRVISEVKYKKLKQATMVIQTRYRAWSVAKQQQCEYKKMKMACISIQSVFRGHQARLLSRQHRAARLIQSVFRMHRLSRKYQQMRSSAIVLQAAFKSHLSCKKFQTLKKSAIKIQQKWKSTLLARRQRKLYLKLKGTVILAQSLYRARLARIYVLRIQASVKIQSAYRGYVAFKNYKDFRKAVIAIQSNVKMSIQRRKYKQILKSTKIIQEHYRAHSRRIEAMKKYQEIKTSCVTIQTYCRRYQARKIYRELRRVTIQMQALVRRKQAMKTYKRTKQAAIVVQRRFRANLLCQQEQKCFHVVKTSCITIQSYYRGFKARQLARQHRSATIIKSFIKMCLIRKEFLKIKCAAIKIQANIRRVISEVKYKKLKQATMVIQTRYRAWSVAKQQQCEYKKMKMACISIQSIFRGHQARLLSRQHRAARLIQSVFRMQRLRTKYQKMRSSAIVLQAAFKCHLGCKKFQMLKKSAIKIQQKWKSTLLARRQRKSYLKLKGTVILAQSLYRARLARIYVQRIQASVKIQSAYRGYVAFKNYKDFRKAVITIQSNVKMSIQKRKYKQILKSTMIIQEHYRAHSRRIEAMKKYQEIKTSCVTIQTYCRRYQARKTYRELRRVTIQMQALVRRKQAMKKYKKTKQAALVVQRCFRANLLCKQEQKCFHVVKTSCITIQSYYRGFKARLLSRQHRAARLIQSVFRMHRLRTKYQKMRSSAIVLQAAFKSHLSHKKFQTLKKSAIKIQQKWKATLLARRQKKSYLKLKGTVILAQSLYRARLARIYVQRIQAAVKIQSAYRGYVAFKNYKDFRKAVITIQSNVKMSIQRRKYKQILKSTKIIQEHYRAHSHRNEAMKKYQEIKTSCVTIQTYCRRYQARKTYRELRRVTIQMQALVRRKQAMKTYKRTKQAAIVVQRRFRANLLCQQEQKCFHVVKTSCITIQSYYRGFKARQLAWQHRSATIIKSFIKMCSVRSKFLKQKSAAIKIQATVKGYIAKKSYKKIIHAAVVIQVRYTAMIRARRIRCEYIRLKDAVVKMQSLHRGNTTRTYVKKIKAAIKIQSSYRRYRLFQKYRRFKQSAIIIQSSFRRYQNVQKYQKLKTAVVRIQQYYMAYRMKKKMEEKFKLMKKSAIVLQSAVRRLQCRRRFKLMKTSCVLIQSRVRGYLVRKHYLEKRNHAIVIQSYVRSWLAWKPYKVRIQQQHSAIMIQKQIRGYWVRRNLKALREAEKARLMQFSAAVYLHMCAIKIQRAYRNARTRKLAKQQLNSIITLQRCFRKKIERRQQEKRLRSVTVIQSYVRMYLAKKYADKRRQSITLLQAMWRGRLLRSQLKSKKIIRIRRNLTAANLKAKEEDKLSNRTTSALDYLKKIKQMSDLLSALEHLEVATRLSAVCCERMATNNGIQTIYELLNGFNRSLPHMQAISRSISILVNLAKYEATVSAVYYVRDKINSINIIMEQIQNFREKGCSIFTKACLLLSILGQHEHIREEILAMPKFTDKIKSLYTLTMRKRKRNVEFERMKSLNSSMFNSFMVAPSYNLNVKPAWNLSTNRMKETEDSLEAIKSVARVFQIQI